MFDGGGKGHAELGLVSASMAVRYEADANGNIVLVMDVVGSRNVALNPDLARAGVKTGPYVRRGARCARLQCRLWQSQNSAGYEILAR